MNWECFMQITLLHSLHTHFGFPSLSFFFLVIWCTTDLLQADVTSLPIFWLFRWFLLDQWLFYLQYSLDSFQNRNLQTNRILVSAENMWSDQQLSNLPGKLKGTSISIIVVILKDCLSIRPCCPRQRLKHSVAIFLTESWLTDC